MRRRGFIARLSGAVAACRAFTAARRMGCIGYLTSQAADDPVSQAYMAALLQGLQKAGLDAFLS
jgi:hypothetical protein